MKETVYLCQTCNKEVNFGTQATTSCGKCKKDFCCNLDSPCFAQHLSSCPDGHPQSILSPEFVVNLVQSTPEEGEDD